MTKNTQSCGPIESAPKTNRPIARAGERLVRVPLRCEQDLRRTGGASKRLKPPEHAADLVPTGERLAHHFF